jgi:zinc transporter
MGELLAEVIYAWILRIEQILHGIDRDVDDMEDHILMDPDADLQQDLTALRQRMIHLGRHLTPQAEALSALQRDRSPWLSPEHRDLLREEYSRILQFVAELASTRDQAALIQDEIRHNQNRKLNETMKIVAVFTAYLMPITAITGLLGTNLEGIPGQAGGDHPWAFTIEVIALLGVMAVSYLVFKKKKWFG